MSEFSFTDFILAILVLIGACVGGYWSYLGSQNAIKTQLKNETKNVAKAFKLDIETVEKSEYFTTACRLFAKNSDGGYDQNTAPYMPQSPWYNKETGLYFIYQHEIAKLDLELSRKIINFYDNLIVAENLRSFISQDHAFFKHDDVERINKYHEMKKLIIKCGDLIPELIEELEKVQNH